MVKIVKRLWMSIKMVPMMTYVVDCVHFLWPTMSLFSPDRVPKTGELLFTLHKIPKSDQQERSYQKPTLLSTPPNCHCHNFKLDYTSEKKKLKPGLTFYDIL